MAALSSWVLSGIWPFRGNRDKPRRWSPRLAFKGIELLTLTLVRATFLTFDASCGTVVTGCVTAQHRSKNRLNYSHSSSSPPAKAELYYLQRKLNM
jgi:hypothetical protein